MTIKVPKNSKLFLSKFGAKGFLYPSEDFILAPKDVTVDEVSYVYSKEYGVVPVRVVVDIGNEAISIKESTIFWVDSELFGK
jgi:hypothetical protein